MIILNKNFEKVKMRFKKNPLEFLALSYILLFLYQRVMPFMDEADNILGGMSIARGHDIYKAYFSQHVPFAYYLSAIFTLLGAHEYEAYRFFWSIFVFLIWVFIYIRYKDFLGKKTIILFTLLYSLMLNYTWGQMFLSDSMEGLSLVIILIELLRFWQRHELKIIDMTVISIFTFVSVMSAFVSLYALFFLFVAFIFHELKWQRHSKQRLKFCFSFGWIMAFPFLVFLIWYGLSKNLDNFIFQAYQFNRIYYSKYIAGFGSSALGAVLSTFKGWINFISLSLTQPNSKDLIPTLLIGFDLLFLSKIFKKERIFAVLLFLFVGFTGLRGYSSFHAAPFYYISFVFASHFFFDSLRTRMELTVYQSHFYKGMMFLLILLASNSYLSNVGSGMHKPWGSMGSTPYDAYISKLTTPIDKIWISNLYTFSYIHNHREPSSRVATLVPWFNDAFRNEILQDIKDNRPKLIVFDPEEDVWGHKYKDFGKEIFIFVQMSYKPLNEFDPIARNIYVPQEMLKYDTLKMWPGNSNLRDGLLVSDSNTNKVYLIENFKKRYIVSTDAFNRHGYNWSEVVTLPPTQLSTVVPGKPVE